MKLKIDAIEAKNLPLTMNGQVAEQPVLKIVAGEFEATTSRFEQSSEGFTFPEAFQLEVEEEEYLSGQLSLEVEAYDFSTGEYVYIGRGSAILASLLPTVDIPLYYHLDIAAYDTRFEGPRPCEVHMRGVVSTKDPLEEELALKQQELDAVKKSFDDYVVSAKELENEMENALQVAQQKIQKLSKKNTATTEKYNELTDTYNSLTEELTRLQEELEALRRSKSVATTEMVTLNEELTTKVTTLTTTTEKYRAQIEVYERERVTMQKELDDLYTSKYEDDLKFKDQLEDLKGQNQKLLESAGDSDLIQDLSKKVDDQTKEISDLRAKAAQAAITVNSTIITNTNISNTVVNNSFFETIVNSTNETNVFITNVIKSGNVEKIREALVNQMRLYDELKGKNFKLLGKIMHLQGNITVCCRVRPPTPEETERGGKLCVDAADDTNLYVYDAVSSEWLSYELDAVWGYDHTQSDVFGDVEPLVGALTEGKNGCVMAYGESGAGKTFTMAGFGEYLGISYRTILKTFEMLDLKKKNAEAETKKSNPDAECEFKFQVDMAVLTVRDDVVYDLLSSEAARVDVQADAGATSTALTIKKAPLYDPLRLTYDAATEDTIVEGLVVRPVDSPSEGMQVLAKAVMVAALDSGTGQLPANTHLVVQVGVTVTKDEASLPMRAALRMVDLAPPDSTKPENHKSNLGICTLQKVMTALSDLTASGDTSAESANDPNKVPYNQSQLTTLLRPSLSGEAKSMLIVNLSPTDLSYKTTLENLQFATTVRGIKVDSGGKAVSSVEIKNMETKVRNARGELDEAKQKYAMIEQSYTDTKTAAKSLVQEMHEHVEDVTQKYEEEKEHNRVLQGDLDIMHANSRKTLEQLKEQLAVNERLMGVIKVMEGEKNELEKNGATLTPEFAATAGTSGTQ
mmetsp:Transcript_24358/g.40654  ORF Transcript_24358/g.40654 Transcript_24358/m.40654 type:complete len:913 (-) Transcript_24358:244-2982(-)